MTKIWEDVREEICRQYGEGRSLEYIRTSLQRQRHFEASSDSSFLFDRHPLIGLQHQDISSEAQRLESEAL